MARIAGIDLPRDKRIEIGLTYIYGIGRTSANKILAQAGVNPDTRVKDLTEEDEAKLREIIHEYSASGISRAAELEEARACGFDAALIGGALMDKPSPGAKLARLLGRS